MHLQAVEQHESLTRPECTVGGPAELIKRDLVGVDTQVGRIDTAVTKPDAKFSPLLAGNGILTQIHRQYAKPGSGGFDLALVAGDWRTNPCPAALPGPKP
jgi:hypothetical protein